MIMLGYKRNRDGVLEIIPEEADIVRMMFSDAMSGMGGQAIANKLNMLKIRTKNGCQWTAHGVRRVLSNEKYCGDLRLQKFYNENHLTKRKMTNDGNLPQIYVEEAHPAIIDRETFMAVQAFLQDNQRFTALKETTGVYPFTGMIKCGCCGKTYRRKTTVTGIVWICNTYNQKGKKFCPTAKQIPEEKLISACCEVLGINHFDADVFQETVSEIIVPRPNILLFRFTDGAEQTVSWQDRSRSESWTPEMKAKAAEHSRKRGTKCQK